MEKVTVSLDEIENKTVQALIKHGAETWIAAEVGKAVRLAEATKNIICGLYYLESYCLQLVSGRVDGKAVPRIYEPRPGSVLVDAKFGFAQAAFSHGLAKSIEKVRNNGIALLGIAHAHTHITGTQQPTLPWQQSNAAGSDMLRFIFLPVHLAAIGFVYIERRAVREFYMAAHKAPRMR